MPWSDLPLCVDLDGTLVKTDTLAEAAIGLIKKQPWIGVLLPFWLLRGKAALKERIALHLALRAENLPYRGDLLEYLTRQKASGRKLVLVTAAHHRYADAVAAHLGLFDSVMATGNGVNLAGSRKMQALESAFGPRGYAYIGNSSVDVPVWKCAGEALFAGGDRAVLRAAEREGIVMKEVFGETGNRFLALLRSLRPHQSLKNVLVFVALVSAHKIGDLERLASAALCFLAFCFCASSAYLINDLMDLDADRSHPTKRRRPFASGDLPLWVGGALAPVLLVAGLAMAYWSAGAKVFAMLAFYFGATLMYSMILKEIVLVDTLVLAGLYVWRVIVGGEASRIVISPWLGAFSVFLFLSLALAKRYTELLRLQGSHRTSAAGRGYMVQDADQIARFGTSSGYLATLVMALYLHSDEVRALYHDSLWLWLLVPLLIYWISRVWLLASRKELNDDPVVFALKDRVSYVVGALVAAVLILAA